VAGSCGCAWRICKVRRPDEPHRRFGRWADTALFRLSCVGP
jgi:hypothetical protein